MIRIVALAADSVRRRKIRSGRSGAGERASIPRNATMSAVAAASSPTVTPLVQPCSLARVIA